MSTFQKIETKVRNKTTLRALLNKNVSSLFSGDSFNDAQNVSLVRDILKGIHLIQFKALETKTSYIPASKEDIDYISSLFNFVENKYSVDGFYFKDLTGKETNDLLDTEPIIFCLCYPFSEEEKASFLNSKY